MNKSNLPISTPPDVRMRYNVGGIFENKAQCLQCEDIIESKHRHDFVTCKCGNLSVDGGSWYLSRTYRHGFESFKELSINYEML
jgi:hypothetical protein